jgi:hypothetical protein
LAVADFAGADELAIRVALTGEVGGRKDYDIDAPGVAAVGRADCPRVLSGPHGPAKDLAATRRCEPRHKEENDDASEVAAEDHNTEG